MTYYNVLLILLGVIMVALHISAAALKVPVGEVGGEDRVLYLLSTQPAERAPTVRAFHVIAATALHLAYGNAAPRAILGHGVDESLALRVVLCIFFSILLTSLALVCV